MIDNFMPYIKWVSSIKNAFIMLLSFFSSYLLLGDIEAEWSSFEIPNVEKFVLCLVFFYTFYSLIVNGSIWLVGKVNSWCKALKSKREIKASIPHLDNVELSLLTKMLTETVSLKRKKKPADHLEKVGLIREVGHKNASESVYELSPAARESLMNYLEGKREKTLTRFSCDLKDEGKEFLRIFFDEVIPFGVPEKEDRMPSNVFEMGKKMVSLELVKKEGYTFTLPEDTKQRLIEDKHFEECYRNLAELDASYIEASFSNPGVVVKTTVSSCALADLP